MGLDEFERLVMASPGAQERINVIIAEFEEAQKMTWNYRVVRTVSGDEELYDIREVYYDSDGTITAWSAEPAAPGSEDEVGLQVVISLMLEARDKPILDARDLPGQVKMAQDILGWNQMFQR